ncbi:MAG: acetyl-CoA carboxylase biotin carboxyl carrier protein subunit [Anaerolineae bacterium]|nr:acetyl-CoA carboxylase biotin carboxyl carrier protein subunit [Anaerolineae bacterium]
MSELAVSINGETFRFEIQVTNAVENKWSVWSQGEPIEVLVPQSDAPLQEMDWLIVDGKPYEIVFDPALRWIQSQGRNYQIHIRDLEQAVSRPHSTDGRIKAPIPGQINQVLVKPEQRVDMGETLIILEAMKMENHIVAPSSGVVSSVHVVPGQGVMLNQVLAEITLGGG